MNSVLPGYQVGGATWFYLSLLVIIALYFKFDRLWSLRNLDLALLLCISPGLLLVEASPLVGYVWLFSVTAVLLVRVFCDAWLTRRPRLEQNLNAPGLAFLGVAAFAFLMTIVVTKSPAEPVLETVRRGNQIINGQEATSQPETPDSGPVQSLIAAPVGAISDAVAPTISPAMKASPERRETLTANVLVILAHLGVVLGLFMAGSRLFGDARQGLAMATLYLLLPCTAYDVEKVNRILPAALILWAIVAYKRPMISGSLLGLACGTLFFPIFLLPLWASFYGRKGGLRFVAALGIVGAVLMGTLALTSADAYSFTRQTFGSIDWSVLKFSEQEVAGFWAMNEAAYRIPVFVAFLVMLVVLTIWPREKNLEHLIASTTAIILGVQFWYPLQGGVYLMWYLPLVLLIIIRPRLAHLLPPTLDRESRADKAPMEPARPQLVASGSPNGRLFR